MWEEQAPHGGCPAGTGLGAGGFQHLCFGKDAEESGEGGGELEVSLALQVVTEACSLLGKFKGAPETCLL